MASKIKKIEKKYDGAGIEATNFGLITAYEPKKSEVDFIDLMTQRCIVWVNEISEIRINKESNTMILKKIGPPTDNYKDPLETLGITKKIAKILGWSFLTPCLDAARVNSFERQMQLLSETRKVNEATYNIPGGIYDVNIKNKTLKYLMSCDPEEEFYSKEDAQENAKHFIECVEKAGWKLIKED